MKLFTAPKQPYYFDEGDNTPPADPPADPPKTFTQEQVNTLLASNKKNLQTDLAKKTKALQDAQNDANLTQDEKDALAIRVGDLESLLLTDKELAARDKKRAATEYKEALDKSSKSETKWKSAFETMLIKTAITDAALVEGQKAVNPSQLVSLFASNAVVTETDGMFAVQLNVPTKGEDGIDKILNLDPTAAIKEYSTRPDYLNLFEDPSKDGLHRRKTSVKPGTIPTNMADYKANRDALVK